MSFSESRRRVFALLRGIEAEPFEITFSGSGDSGWIDDIGIPDDPECVLDLFIGYDSHVEHFEGLHKILDAFAYEVIDESGHLGWENNDGGWGTIHFDPTAGTIKLDMNVNIMSSELTEHTL